MKHSTVIWTCGFFSLVLTQHSPSLLLHSPLSNTHRLHAVLMSLCGSPIFFFPLHAPFPSSIPLVSPTSSCLWKTPRQSCHGSRGTQTPTASGLWLSLLCQVCQVCVCDVTGKLTPCWLRVPHPGLESAWYPNWVPFCHFLSTLLPHGNGSS